MKECEHIIGMYYDLEETDVLTIEEAKQKIAENDLTEYGLTIEENMWCFEYCPECGEKLNWNKIRKYLRNKKEK